jgi:hypothetical protein
LKIERAREVWGDRKLGSDRVGEKADGKKEISR